MSYPILYPPDESAFDSNGIGMLGDAVSCAVTEERNGQFELQMEYPVTGRHFADIGLRSLILARPNPYDEAQPFRVYRVTRPLGGIVTFYAEHISYDLAGIVASPFEASSASDAIAQLALRASTPCPFSFWTDKTTQARMSAGKPTSLRSLLGGQSGSILDVYGGEYKFDRFQVSLYGQRGSDRGVSIRYGKNLTDIRQEENCSGVYTGVYPFWADSDGNVTQLADKIVSAEGTYPFTRILPLDLSGEWQDKPSEEQLLARAREYMKSNNVGVPSVSLDVSFAQLEQSEEYRGIALFERVALCDTVTVVFPAMGVEATAKVTKTVYDVLLDRYESVSIGDARYSLADTIVQQAQETDRKIGDTRTHLQKAVDKATQAITGNSGGYVVLHDGNGDGHPDELLVMDREDIGEAAHVWRWNQEGLGYSGTGYDGPYGTAITADGHIMANYVNAGELDATVVKAGVLRNLDEDAETFYLNISTGELRMKASRLSIESAASLDVGGESLDEYTQGKVGELDGKLTQQEVFDRLTGGKANQGIYIKDGNLYINASMINAGELTGIVITGNTIRSMSGGKRIEMDTSSALKGYDGNALVNAIDMSSEGATNIMTLDAKNAIAIRTPSLYVANKSYGTGSGAAQEALTGPHDIVSSVSKNMDPSRCKEVTIEGILVTLPVFLNVSVTTRNFVNGVMVTGKTVKTNVI